MLTRRRGFTVLEIIVSLFLLAVITAAVVPTLMRRIRDAEKSALSQTLFSLSLAIVEYRKAVSVNPRALTNLSTLPGANATDACGNPMVPATVANWRGPYITRELLESGVGMGDATIRDTLRRVPGPPVRLFIDVMNVDTNIAAELDAQFDGASASPVTGTIRYTNAALGAIPAPPAGMVTLSYAMPITGC